MNDLTLTFHGGAGSVTGSCFLLEQAGDAHDAVSILVDCGLKQGSEYAQQDNREPFEFDPADVDVLFVTHAHIDHIGRIPKLIKDGFSGTIYSTPATRELAEIMFDDSLSIMRYEKKEKDLDMLYEREDVEKALEKWETISYYTDTDIDDDFSVHFSDAGHILGSAIIEIDYRGEKIVFTGDLGNSPSPLLRDTDRIEGARYMVMESVYGDRNHEPKEGRSGRIQKIAERTFSRGGTLLIPAFSIERTQILLYELNELIENGDFPDVPVFLDSPLAINVTRVYREKEELFNDTIQSDIAGGDKIFDFPRLEFTESVEDSKKINDISGPKVIIAGSGMSQGGRILHHEKRYLHDPDSTMLIVGYQAPGSLGRKIQEGVSSVDIMGDTIPVNADIETIFSYSAHKDSEDLLEFASHTAQAAEKIFVAMGEPKSSAFLAQRIHDFLGVDAVVPEEGDTFRLTF